MEHGLARSGWVFRQSSILKNWTKVHMILYQNGDLEYFDDETKNARAKDSMSIPRECLDISVGAACKHVDPPTNHLKSELFSVVPRHGSTWQLCAFNVDERTAWQMSLEEARGMRSPLLRRTRSVNDLFLPKYATYGKDMMPPSAGYPGPPPPAGQYAYMPGQYDRTGQYRPPGYVYESAPGQVTQVYYVDRPGHYYRGSDYSLGMGLMGGALTGYVLGSTLAWPLLFWC